MELKASASSPCNEAGGGGPAPQTPRSSASVSAVIAAAMMSWGQERCDRAAQRPFSCLCSRQDAGSTSLAVVGCLKNSTREPHAVCSVLIMLAVTLGSSLPALLVLSTTLSQAEPLAVPERSSPFPRQRRRCPCFQRCLDPLPQVPVQVAGGHIHHLVSGKTSCQLQACAPKKSSSTH